MAAQSISRGCLNLCAGTTATSTLLTRSFALIASRQTLRTAPVLEFLAPSISPRSYQCPRIASRGAPKRLVSRCFSSSAARRQTKVIYNPRKDDDGADMNVEITPRAANVRAHPPSSLQLSFRNALHNYKNSKLTQLLAAP
jgi:hypothetical protein